VIVVSSVKPIFHYADCATAEFIADFVEEFVATLPRTKFHYSITNGFVSDFVDMSKLHVTATFTETYPPPAKKLR